MAVAARDLRSSRLRRWGALTLGGVAALGCLIWAARAGSEARAKARSVAEWEHRLSEHEARADELARGCDIPFFSDELSLEHFPMEVRPFPTQKEKDCVRDVGVARADLIDDYLKLHDLRPELPVARAASRRSAIAAALVIAIWIAALYVLEIRPRRSGA